MNFVPSTEFWKVDHKKMTLDARNYLYKKIKNFICDICLFIYVLKSWLFSYSYLNTLFRGSFQNFVSYDLNVKYQIWNSKSGVYTYRGNAVSITFRLGL